MKKLKIYLDTSVISHLDAPDTPEKMADTLRLWEQIKNGLFEVVLSNVVITEIDACSDVKRNTLFNYLSEIRYAVVEIDAQIMAIARRFINFGILRQKSFDDCQHIASAISSKCDVIVSWNFKHIVNYKTIIGIKAISAIDGLNDILICTPSFLVGGETDDS
jgi:predicted nucleic acid-binding protein